MPPIKLAAQGLLAILIGNIVSGAHGAVTLTKVEARHADGTVDDLTPVSTTLKEEAVAAAVPIAMLVSGGGSAPAFSAGGGTGGMDVYTVTVDDTTGMAPGDYVRKQAAGLTGVFKVDSITDGTHMKIFAGQNEIDFAGGDTLEKCDPTGKYYIQVAIDYADLDDDNTIVEAWAKGAAAADRGNKPAVADAFEERRLEVFWKQVDSSNTPRVY